jgi:FKBP-type peptidyl-prolyl cis-trans isomerase FklB
MVDRTNIARRISAALLVLTLVAGFAWAQAPAIKVPEALSAAPTPAGEIKSDKQILSYGLGLQMGGQMRRNLGEDMDTQAFLRGVADAVTGGKLAVSEADLSKVMAEFQQKIMKRQLEALKANPKWQALAAKNKKDGEAFMAANKTKEGVKTLPSGLQYKVIKSGNGATPAPTDSVVADYHGTLVDGTVFDSSVERGKPETFPVNRVVKGWTEALQLMKVGDKWQLVVPPELAYGEMGNESIGPSSTLIFEVELKDVKKQPGAK